MFKTEQEFNEFWEERKKDIPEIQGIMFEVTPEGHEGKQYITVSNWEQYKKEFESVGYTF